MIDFISLPLKLIVNVILLVATVGIITLNKQIPLKNDPIMGLNEGDILSSHDCVNGANAEGKTSPNLKQLPDEQSYK